MFYSFPKHSMMFEVCERCFEVFFEASERLSVCISLGVFKERGV